MNSDDITMGEYSEHCGEVICCIHDYVCHWCQHSSKFVKTDKVVDNDICIKENRLIIFWCTIMDVYYSMSWSWGLVHGI